MKLNLTAILLLGLSSIPLVHAQTPADDPLRDVLFSPELVMQNQQALGLSEEQRNYFKSEVAQAQTHFTEQQWKLQSEMERMVALLKQPNVDERQALTQLDSVLAAEREVKRTQVALLIRIKDHLQPAQQAQLKQLQNKMREGK